MSARRIAGMARWTAGLTLALGLHGAAAFLLLSRWHADADELTSAPAILVDFAPAPAAPALTPTELPPGPPQPQQQAQPEPAPKQAVAKVEVQPQPEKPVEKTIELPPEPAPQPTIDVLPPRRPAEVQPERKLRRRQASRASAPPTAAHRSMHTAALTPGASARNPDALPSWRSALVAQIERHKHYPDKARARGEHGVAQVAFSVDRRGGLHDVHIVRSSGSTLLDRDALAWLRRSQPLPPPPAEVRGARIPVIVPLRYDIR
jgi:protein TonB